jgi:uncharacterized membrane protein
MLIPSLLSSDVHEMGPRGLMLGGAVCLLMGIWFSIAIANDRLRAIFRWHEDGSGPAMSPLGAGVVALIGYLLAAMFFAYAFEWRAAASFLFYPLFAAIAAAVLVTMRDSHL